MRIRTAAILTLQEVVTKQHSLQNAISVQARHVAQSDQAVYRQLIYGTLRRFHALDLILSKMLEKPLNKKHADIKLCVILGLYELSSMSTPDHAVVNETVKTVDELGKSWAKKLVNALLRRWLREHDSLTNSLGSDPIWRFSHPQWLYETIKKDWPEYFEEILDANNIQPPLTLRINRLLTDRSSYQKTLSSNGIHAENCELSDVGLNLSQSTDVRLLPGFDNGTFQVQDEASQLVPSLLKLKPGLRVLDACAAPGGKTTHLIESCSELDLTALDKDARRLEVLKTNLARHGFSCKLMCCDAVQSKAWWSGKQYDRILLDAPCSATGIIRRKPDIKVLRRESDIDKLAEQQLALLKALWPLLSPSGILLYTTCSILSKENSHVIKRFLEFSKATEIPIDAPWGQRMSHGRQLLPVRNGHDGFYYAQLQKIQD